MMARLNQLADRVVSIVLMVAVTIALAVVIATFVLDIGTTPEQAGSDLIMPEIEQDWETVGAMTCYVDGDDDISVFAVTESELPETQEDRINLCEDTVPNRDFEDAEFRPEGDGR